MSHLPRWAWLPLPLKDHHRYQSFVVAKRSRLSGTLHHLIWTPCDSPVSAASELGSIVTMRAMSSLQPIIYSDLSAGLENILPISECDFPFCLQGISHRAP